MSERFGASAALFRGSVEIAGRLLTLEVRDCRVCLGGEFAGNVDVRVACEAGAEMEPVRRLELRLPGEPETLDVVGSGPVEGGLEFTFGSLALVERLDRNSGSDHDERELWIVSLEGPIAWQGEAREVHLRSDSLDLATRGSDLAARRFAARVGSTLGLPILDTSDTGM